MRVSGWALLLLPLRVAVMTAAEIAAVAVAYFAPEALLRPMFTVCARVLLWTAGFGVGSIRISSQAKTQGASGIYSRITPSIIVSNHASVLDGFVLAFALGAPSFLAKSSMAALPIYGTILRGLGVEFVDRESAESRSRAGEVLRQRSTATNRPPIVIFPEGTTADPGSTVLRPFRLGAFRPGAPVLPVFITYGPDSYWVHGDDSEQGGDLWVLLRLMVSAPFHAVEIKVLDPYWPNEAERLDPKLFAMACRDIVSSGGDSASSQ